MNYAALILLVTHVLSANIRLIQTAPNPPNQFDIDLIVNSANAQQGGRKDFDLFLNELLSQPIPITTTKRRSTIDEEIIWDVTTEMTTIQEESEEDVIKRLADEIFVKYNRSQIETDTTGKSVKRTTSQLITPTTTEPPIGASDAEACAKLAEYESVLLQIALSYARFEHRLLLTGRLPPMTVVANAVDVLREFIADRLQMPHLTPLIVQAQRLDDDQNILFEMATTKASLELLAKSRVLLENSKFCIEVTDKNFIDISFFSRVGN